MKRIKNLILHFLSFIFLEVLLLEQYYLTGWHHSWYDIRKKKNEYFKVISKSIMAGQKCKKKLVEIFGIFECLLTQNPTNQDSKRSWFFQIIWTILRKSINTELQGIILTWEWLQNLLHSKFHKMVENWILWFLKLYFYAKYISNKDDIWQGVSSWRVIRTKKTEHFKIIKNP